MIHRQQRTICRHLLRLSYHQRETTDKVVEICETGKTSRRALSRVLSPTEEARGAGKSAARCFRTNGS